jgi:hypothetical protein
MCLHGVNDQLFGHPEAVVGIVTQHFHSPWQLRQGSLKLLWLMSVLLDGRS